MTITNFFFFFTKHLNFKIWLKLFLSFFLNLIIIFSEIVFLSLFLSLLNRPVDSKIYNYFYNYLEYLLIYLDTDFSPNEISIIFLIFFLIFKNILTLFNNAFVNSLIFGLSAEKSTQLLRNYMNKTYEIFSKKEISVYTKEIIRDVENVFTGILGLIILFVGELVYTIIIVYFVLNLVEIELNLKFYILFSFIFISLYILLGLAQKAGNLRSTNEIKIFKSLADILNIFKEIKLSYVLEDFLQRFNIFLKEYYKSRVYSYIINLTPKFFLEIFVVLFFFILFTNDTSVKDFNEFIIKYSVLAIGFLRLIPSFSRLSSYSNTIFYNLDSIKFIKNDLDNLSYKKREFFSGYKLDSIKLKNVSLIYSKKDNSSRSLKNNFNYEFKKNNFYGIYGDSGSGKTTLLNTLIGFIKSKKGKIIYNGKVINPSQIIKKFKIGYAPQLPTILDENIEINATLKYKNNAKKVSKIKKLLTRFNLKKFTNKKYFKNLDKNIFLIKNISGGEKQRLSLIRSIINNPDLILLDEPTSALDRRNEVKVFKFLNSIKKNKIIIVSTHKKQNQKFFDKIIKL